MYLIKIRVHMLCAGYLLVAGVVCLCLVVAFTFIMVLLLVRLYVSTLTY
jgi:hypothetical protein